MTRVVVHFDTFLQAFEVLVLVLLISTVLAVAVGTFLADNSECDDLPLQRPRLTPEPPRVRKCPFDQDVMS